MRLVSLSCALMVLSLSVLSCGSPGPQDQGLPPSAKVTVTATTRLVSLDVQNAPLGALLAELGQHAHITVSMPDEMKSERLTLSFQHRPLEDALRQVLAGQSYSFLYRQERGQDVVAGVHLFAQHPPTPNVASPGTRALAFSQANQRLSTFPPATRAWGRAGTTNSEATRVTISDDLPLDELKRSLTETQDPALRSATLEAIAGRGEDEPVTPILAKALSDPDQGVRDTALTEEVTK